MLDFSKVKKMWAAHLYHKGETEILALFSNCCLVAILCDSQDLSSSPGWKHMAIQKKGNVACDLSFSSLFLHGSDVAGLGTRVFAEHGTVGSGGGGGKAGEKQQVQGVACPPLSVFQIVTPLCCFSNVQWTYKFYNIRLLLHY